jgi:hypothetical protein
MLNRFGDEHDLKSKTPYNGHSPSKNKENAMHEGRLVFAQIVDYLPRYVFDQCVKKYKGNHKVKDFNCRDQFFAMFFAQLTSREGLRGIELTLRANQHSFYHMGFRSRTVSRNTLANANEVRPWQIWAELAQELMKRAQGLYVGEPFALNLDAKVFALDSTTIDFCLARFPWTPSQQSKAAVKAHVLLNLRGNIPDFIVVSGGKTHDVNILDPLDYVPGAYYIMDPAPMWISSGCTVCTKARRSSLSGPSGTFNLLSASHVRRTGRRESFVTRSSG